MPPSLLERGWKRVINVNDIECFHSVSPPVTSRGYGNFAIMMVSLNEFYVRTPQLPREGTET